MIDYFQYFNNKLFDKDYDLYNNFESNEGNENQNQNNEKDAVKDDFMKKQIEACIDCENHTKNYASLINKGCCYNIRNKNIYSNKDIKLKKIKKMKNYNIKKGDWQCKYCFNINFHFRVECNVCHNDRN